MIELLKMECWTWLIIDSFCKDFFQLSASQYLNIFDLKLNESH